MTSKQFAALLGFLFVGAWIGFGFGDAILCLIGAVVFYLAAGVKDGEIDLGELQARLGSRRSAGAPIAPDAAGGVVPPRSRSSRVH